MTAVAITAEWLANPDADSYRLYHNGSLIHDGPEVGWSWDADIPDGAHNFSLEAYNQHGHEPRQTISREFQAAPKAPEPTEGFDVRIVQRTVVAQPPEEPPGESSYTPTHYVEAKGTAALDQADDGSGAFAAATSSSTPCSLQTAMSNCSAGNVIQVAAGTYHYAGTPVSKEDAGFHLEASGTASEPIIFFAEYPAAYNQGSTSLYSTFVYDDYTGPFGQTGKLWFAPAAGTGALGPARNYVIMDGFHLDNNTIPQRDGAGMTICTGTTGIQFRRLFCENLDGEGGRNNGYIFASGFSDMTVSDCYFHTEQPGSYQLIETYAATNLIVEYCVFSSASAGMYFKGTRHTNCTFRYNHCDNSNHATGGRDGIGISTTLTSENPSITLHNNLVSGSWSQPLHLDETTENTWNGVKLYNNTFYRDANGSASTIGTIRARSSSSSKVNNDFYNNIFICPSNVGNMMVGTGLSPGDLDTCFDLFDYNLYYELGGGDPLWQTPSGNLTGLSALKSAYPTIDQNSTQEDPLFTDAANGDFTLQPSSPARSGGRGGAHSSVRGCYITGNEEIGLRANPTY